MKNNPKKTAAFWILQKYNMQQRVAWLNDEIQFAKNHIENCDGHIAQYTNPKKLKPKRKGAKK